MQEACAFAGALTPPTRRMPTKAINRHNSNNKGNKRTMKAIRNKLSLPVQAKHRACHNATLSSRQKDQKTVNNRRWGLLWTLPTHGPTKNRKGLFPKTLSSFSSRPARPRMYSVGYRYGSFQDLVAGQCHGEHGATRRGASTP